MGELVHVVVAESLQQTHQPPELRIGESTVFTHEPSMPGQPSPASALLTWPSLSIPPMP